MFTKFIDKITFVLVIEFRERSLAGLTNCEKYNFKFH